MVRFGCEDADGLARWYPLDLRNVVLDQEVAARSQMRGGVTEAGDLLILAGEIRDRVAEQVDEAEHTVDDGRGEVTNADRDGVTVGLSPKPRRHGLGQFDAVHPHH